MTKKKRNHPDVEEIIARPWCYYCERDFDDLKILINHQKAKHFKCERCGRRLNTAGGLSVHMSQVHKENLSAVDNALPNRAGLDIEIFAMEGIPEDIVQAHQQRVLQNFHQAEAERRQASGSQGPGAVGGQPKKPKFESPADLKKRLAEHKAAKLAAEANGDSSGSATPLGAGQASAQSLPMPGQNGSQASSQQYPPYQQPYSAPQSQPNYGAPASQPPFGGPPQQQPYGVPPTQQQGYGLPHFNSPPSSMPYDPQRSLAQASFPNPHQQPPFQPPHPALSPPPYQSQSPYPPQPYPPAQPFIQNGPPQFQGQPGIPPRQHGAGSPGGQFQQQSQFLPRNNTPSQSGFPPRPPSGSLPPALGLPQRPAFQAPPVNAFQFQQMHQGQIPGSQNGPPAQPSHAQQNMQVFNGNGQQPPQMLPPVPEAKQEPADVPSLDDAISNAREAESSKPIQAADIPDLSKPELEDNSEPVPAKKEDGKEEGKKDKDKSKVTKLVYNDNEISPEEKMAEMARYAYIPDRNDIRV